MNNAQQIATVMYNAAGLCALWILLRCWRDYKTDKLRQDIFNLRAELFDFARGGGLPFNDRSYVLFRLLLNSMIRFAHEISFVRLATTLVLERFRPTLTLGPSFMDELEAASLSDSARCKLTGLHSKLLKLVAVQILTTSLAAFPVLFFYVVYMVVTEELPARRRAKVVEASIREHMQLIEQQAMETRELELQQQEAAACV
jgi:hypothetical protein